MSVRSLLRILGWLAAASVALVIAFKFACAENLHARSLVVSLAGALILVMPPIRQLFRIYPYRKIPERSAAVSERVIFKARMRQVFAFCEFSRVDVVCWFAGPLLLAAGFVLDELSGEPPAHVAATHSQPWASEGRTVDWPHCSRSPNGALAVVFAYV